MPRLVKVFLRVVLGLIVLYVALCAMGAVLAMRIPRLPLKGSPASAGLTYTDVSFPSRNSNFTLDGWFIPGTGNKTIIIVHGGFQNRLDDNVDTLDLTKSLVADGYNVLLFDLRGRGESQGTGLNILTNEDDIGGAVDYLRAGESQRTISALSGSVPGPPARQFSPVRTSARWCWTAASPAWKRWLTVRPQSGISPLSWWILLFPG